jgi:uncharacterized membrane protein (DUF4010 family)
VIGDAKIGAPASRLDNVHVLLWLIKDTCWMLEWQALGTLMIAPTIGVAVYLAVRSFGDRGFWINLAICFWITANAYWMVVEFAGREDIKNFAGIPFALGLVSVAVFYLSRPGHGAPRRLAEPVQ